MRLSPRRILVDVAAVVLATASASEAVLVREAHYVMGTVLEITVEAEDELSGRRLLRDAVSIAVKLDHALTSYDDSSDLAELNRRAGFGSQRVPPALYDVISRGLEGSAATEGAFDMTVGPFFRARPELEEPRPIEETPRLIGADLVRLVSPDRVELRRQGMAIDLGGIGKGYAADRIADLFRQRGVTSALANFGESTFVAVGPPPSSPPWEVWLRVASALLGPLQLRDGSFSTSRTARDDGGEPVFHLVDPRSGRPIEVSRQVSVLGPSGVETEIWSTAVAVEPGMLERAGSAGLEAIVLENGRARTTERFYDSAGWQGPRP